MEKNAPDKLGLWQQLKQLYQRFDLMGAIWLHPHKTPPDKRYASFNKRMFAATIDCVIALVTLGPILNRLMPIRPIDMLAIQQAAPNQMSRVFLQEWIASGVMTQMCMQIILLGLLVWCCWYKWSLGIRIVDATTGKPMSTSQSIKRLLGYIISPLPFCAGFFWIGINTRCQAWHDLFAGTLVVNIKHHIIPGSVTVPPSDSPAP